VRIVNAGDVHGLVLRVLGGLGVGLHAPSAARPELARAYVDIDFAIPSRRSAEVEQLLVRQGYTPDKPFNTLNGQTRLLFYDQLRKRQLDVFVGHFEMCHRLPIAERLDVEPLTLPLAELLLTKLQIVQLNDKDVRDLCALLLDHPLGEHDDETINVARINALCGADWGLWKTAMLSLDRVRAMASGYGLPAVDVARITGNVDDLQRALQASPKSLRWKARSAVGERVQWYAIPEEVQRG
jgi:hypothetical protein